MDKQQTSEKNFKKKQISPIIQQVLFISTVYFSLFPLGLCDGYAFLPSCNGNLEIFNKDYQLYYKHFYVATSMS